MTSPNHISWRLFALVALWGTSPWLLVNGLFGELPIFVNHTKEGNAIANYFGVAGAISNIFAFLFAFVDRSSSAKRSSPPGDDDTESTDVSESIDDAQVSRTTPLVIAGVLICGILSSILIAIFWDTQSGHHNWALLILSFLAGGIGNTSMVTFWPFVTTYLSGEYIPAMSIGMGLSGVITSVLTLIQDSGSSHPRFSVETFFWLIAVVYALNLVAFLWILHLSDFFRSEFGSVLQLLRSSSSAAGENVLINAASHSPSHTVDTVNIVIVQEESSGLLTDQRALSDAVPKDEHAPNQVGRLSLIGFSVFLCAYSINSVEPYTVDPFSNSGKLLMWISVVSCVADTCGRGLTHFHMPHVHPGYLLTCVVAPLYVVACVSGFDASGFHSFVGDGGGFLSVILYTVFFVSTGLTITTTFHRAKVDIAPEHRMSATKYISLSASLGSAVGNMVMFALIQLKVLK